MSSGTPARPSHVRLLILAVLTLPTLPSCGGSDAADDIPRENAGSSTPAGSAGAANAMPAALAPDSQAAAASDSWSSYAQGFFSSYCVSCHNDDNAGVAARDFHLRTAVDAEADEIACGLSKSTPVWNARGCTGFPPARQFPIGNGAKPSDAERDRLIAWIDAGRP